MAYFERTRGPTMTDSPRSDNLTWHEGRVSAAQRAELLGHEAACVWMSGLSGSGKSTLARRLEELLTHRGVQAYVLDGDNLRMGLNRDLGFSDADRTENIRRVAEVARLLVDSGAIVLCAFISPFRADRESARGLIDERFIEVYLNPGLAACEERDPKGLYLRARRGEIDSFTGISSPYEAPEAPELELDTSVQSIEESCQTVLGWLEDHAVIPSRTDS